MPKSALITGITGQDGSYLAELLLEHGYEVHGMVRRASTEKFDRIEHIRDRITLHQGDLLDQRSLVDTLRAARPTEIYNLAAMSFVAVSWIQPTLTAEFTGVGVTRMLEAMREVCPQARFYQASSSEMFGKVREVPQVEVTAHHNMLDADRERIAASEVQPGDELALCDEMPPAPEWTVATTEMAELLGLMAADGDVGREGKGPRFTNNDLALRIKVATL